MTSKKAGDEQFITFYGTVEDRDDPMQLGRVRVRIFNKHTDDKSVLPTNNLPWAIPLQGYTSAAANSVGISPTGITNNSIVFGYFADHSDQQIPVILGTYAGMPNNVNDVHKNALGTNALNKQLIPDVEPKSPYKAKYPYNKTLSTESGHLIEVDDTPGHERIHIYHKEGSYIEIGPNGQLVAKGTADSYLLTVEHLTLYSGGDTTHAVQANLAITVGGSAAIGVKGDCTANIGGNLTANVAGDATITAKGDLSINSDGDITLKAGGDVIIKGTNIRLN